MPNFVKIRFMYSFTVPSVNFSAQAISLFCLLSATSAITCFSRNDSGVPGLVGGGWRPFRHRWQTRSTPDEQNSSPQR